MQRRPLKTLQAARGLAAVSVVLFHCNALMTSTKYFGKEISRAFEPASSGVQFFFVLSGFVILLAHRKDLGHPLTFRIFFSKRFKRIYPPLWIALVVLVPIYVFVPSFVTTGDRSPSIIAAAFLVSPTAVSETFLTVEWTLRHEILFYALFSLSLLSRNVGLAILAAWMLASAVVPWLHPSPIERFYFNENHLLFGGGMLVCLLYTARRLRNAVAWTLLLAGVTVFAFTWLAEIQRLPFQADAFFLYFGLGALLIVAGLVNLERNEAISAHEILVYLGEASYAIYLVHYPVVAALTKLCMHTPLRFSPRTDFVLLASSAVVAGCLFHSCLEQPVTHWITARSTKAAAS